MDEKGTRAEAVAWRNGTIVSVGTEEHVLEAAGDGARTEDAAGCAVLPGFVDAHHHISIGSLYAGLVRLAPPEVRDIPGLQKRLARASRELPPGRWLVATHWDEHLLAERRPPTRAELDDAVGDRPVFALHYSCHRALANSRALELAGIDRNAPDPPGGAIGRDRTGQLDGLLIERGMSPVEALARPDLVHHDTEGFLDRMGAHYRAIVAAGITCVGDACVPTEIIEIFREAARRGLVLVPTVLFPVSTTGYLEEPWDALEGPPTGEEDGLLRMGPVKLVFDGAPVCAMCLGWWQATAAFFKTVSLSVRTGSFDPVRTSLSVQPKMSKDGKLRSGISMYGPHEAERIVNGAMDRGFAVATHCIGNGAVDVALTAYERAGGRLADAGRPRLEHASFLDREAVARIAGCGAAVAVQPSFLSLPAYDSAVSVPGLRFFPLRWLLDSGVLVAGSSDFPVDEFDPLKGIRAAVDRRTTSGRSIEPDQQIGLDEALALYTRMGAEACGLGDRTGTLEPGKRADIVVFDGPLKDRRDLESVRVRATVVGGDLLHGSISGS